MKKLIAVVVAVIFTTCPVQAAEYPGLLRITSVKGNAVEGVDANGFLFAFYDAEDWEPDNLCAVIFDDNGTEKIFDDEIRSTRYVGSTEMYE